MTDFAKHWINLTSAKLGAVAVECSDDFFAPMHRMLSDSRPVFVADKYDANGKWMDGWESRRRRGGGHDWCIVKLARAAVIHAVEIDTAHFTGNYPPRISLDACRVADDASPNANTEWRELIARADVRGDHLQQFNIAGANAKNTYSHIRLNLYPDGGIARLRVYGAPKIDWRKLAAGDAVDLASALNGAVAPACNDEHFGAVGNIIAPGDGVNMGDGWETRRRRAPGHDWAIIALAHCGVVSRIEISTAHFKGNYPERCSVQGARLVAAVDPEQLARDSEHWELLLPPTKLTADAGHVFDQLAGVGAITHARLNIYPDGGISRLRLFGAPHF